jgi:hypothetical protein
MSTVIDLFSRTGAANTSGGRSRTIGFLLSSNASSILVEKPDWENEVTGNLRFLLELKEGWDGFDAKPLDLDSALFGLKLLNFVLPAAARAPRLSPTNYGGLQFEWFSKSHELEIEIEAPYRVRVLFVDNTADEALEKSFDYEYGELRDLLEKALNREESKTNASAAA